jgi:hypothetical protein
MRIWRLIPTAAKVYKARMKTSKEMKQEETKEDLTEETRKIERSYSESNYKNPINTINNQGKAMTEKRRTGSPLEVTIHKTIVRTTWHKMACQATRSKQER